MGYIVVFLLGLVVGGICGLLVMEAKRLRFRQEKDQIAAQAREARESMEEVRAKQEQLKEWAAKMKSRYETRESDSEAAREKLDGQIATFRAEEGEFKARIVSYKELEEENGILKRDLQNVDVNLRKLQLDREVQQKSQEQLDQRGRELGSRYLKDTIKWISSSLTTNNFAACKERLQKVVGWSREIGFVISQHEEDAWVGDLREQYEKAVRGAYEREEQARIKAQIREEQRLQKEVDREIAQLDRERAAIQAALDKAMAEAKDQQHSDEIERLKARLAEAEEKSRRAISQAQITKAGYVYVISNIGSFGEGVFKVGVTRRLEPMDRVRELGDASVPFPFDVHMMISCKDAPALELALHQMLHKARVNKTNPRKEFFKADLEQIRKIVVENHGEVEYVLDPEALEYRQSIGMSEEDQEFIENVYEKVAGDRAEPADDE